MTRKEIEAKARKPYTDAIAKMTKERAAMIDALRAARAFALWPATSMGMNKVVAMIDAALGEG